MNLLLDTHAFLWWLDKRAPLGDAAREALIAAQTVWVSAVTAWEIAIKTALGRLKFAEPPETFVPREMERSGFHSLPVSIGHALAVGRLPPHHRDPFDRLLIVQAQIEGLTLVTVDRAFRRYDVRVLDAAR